MSQVAAEDTTFGTAGVATVAATLNGPWAIKAASDGSIFVAAGAVSASGSRWQPVVLKLTPAGTRARLPLVIADPPVVPAFPTCMTRRTVRIMLAHLRWTKAPVKKSDFTWLEESGG